MEQCELCGKQLTNHKEIFHLKGKTLCYDCAYSKKCISCGRTIKGSETCHIDTGNRCCDCLFSGGIKEYEEFKQELTDINTKNKKTHDDTERKGRAPKIVFAIVLFVVVNALIVLLKTRIGIQLGGIPTIVIWAITIAVIRKLIHKKPFKNEMSETDYYYNHWKKREQTENKNQNQETTD